MTDFVWIETYSRNVFTHVIIAVTKENRYFFTPVKKITTKMYNLLDDNGSMSA
jgi:hypothetical protein